MKFSRLVELLFLVLLTTSVNASIISNGNFGDCNFTGWKLDTDGLGDISTGQDFHIAGTSPSCLAVIEADHFSIAGDPFSIALDETWFANTLYQELDFSSFTNSEFSLSIDYSVESERNSNHDGFIADYFFIGIKFKNDQQLLSILRIPTWIERRRVI